MWDPPTTVTGKFSYRVELYGPFGKSELMLPFLLIFCDYFLTHSSGPANQKCIVKSSLIHPFFLLYGFMVCWLILREKSVHHKEEYKVRFTFDIPKNEENQLLLHLSGDDRLTAAELLCLCIQIVLYLTFNFFLFLLRISGEFSFSCIM